MTNPRLGPAASLSRNGYLIPSRLPIALTFGKERTFATSCPSKGSIVFDLERMNELELYIEEGPESGFKTILVTDAKHPYIAGWWPPGHIIGYEHTFIAALGDFLGALAKKEPFHPNFEDAVEVQRVLEAVEGSASSLKWVKV